VLSSLIAPSCPVTVRRLPPSTSDACLNPVDINADLGSEAVHHLLAEEFELRGPGRLIDLDHEHAVFKANRSHVPRDKVTNDLLPPAEEASNLTTIGSTQPLENAIERLRQGRQAVFHSANVLASSVLFMNGGPNTRAAQLFMDLIGPLAQTDAVRFLRAVARFVLGRGLMIQLLPNARDLPLVRLGSKYGGWVLLDDPGIKDGLVISGGAGEDISFDVELSARYPARLVIVDPTPRAVAHVKAVLARIGQPAEVPYALDGSQPVNSYDLQRVDPARISLLEAALASEIGTLELFEPEVTSHVSYSAIKPEQREARSIQVPALTVTSVLQEESLPLKVLKLDIEGIAANVLREVLSGGHRPSQILTEFDELLKPTRTDLRTVKSVDRELRANGYRRVHTDRWSNFTYILTDRS
jgi:FkbM family methyltransferase